MIKVDFRELVKFEKDLSKFSKKAFLFAEKQTINDGAFFAMKETKKLIRREFTTRNTFTERSIQVNKAKSLNSPVAKIGSTQDYFVDQEFGGVRQKPAIPTTSASGEGIGAKVRKKAVRKRNRGLTLGKNRSRLPVAAQIQGAIAAKEKFVFLDLGRKKGIFHVTKKEVTMLYDLSLNSVTVKKRPTLLPATNKARRRMEGFYLKAIKFQLKRQGLFV